MIPVDVAAYDTADYVLNLARAIVNDAAQSIAGNLLSDITPYTFVLLNSAYRDIQEELADRGIEYMTTEITLTQIAPVLVPDPGIQTSISYTGYNNGTSNFETPFLPGDFLTPLRLWERQTGVVSNYIPMMPVNDGLPSTPQTAQFRWWEWRESSIWMLGATQQNDIRMRYIPYLTELTDGDQPILIPRVSNAMAYLVASKFAAARGSPLADTYLTISGQYIDRIGARTARKKQRGSHRRNAYGSWQGWGFGVFGY